MEVIATPDRVKVVLLSSFGEIQQFVRVILLMCCIEAESTSDQIFLSQAHETVAQVFKVFDRKVLFLHGSQ